MKSIKRISCLAIVAGFAFTAVACGGGGGGGGSTGSIGDDLGAVAAPQPDSGTVTLLATDAETDQFREINLTITKAELLSENGPQTLFSGEKKFNLLALAEVTEVFSVTEVPAGNYSKIRLTLTEIELVFHDDREPAYPALPGNGKLDLNPKGAFYVDSDNPLAIQLDFDAEKSIHIIGAGKNNEKFNFRPVVFTKIIKNEFDTKLIRQRGTVGNLDGVAGEFDLCLVEEPSDCVRVDTNSAPATIFGDSGQPISFEELVDGAIITVVGRLFLSSDLVAASSAGSSVLRSLNSTVSAADQPDGKGKSGIETLDDDEFEDDESEDDVSEDDVSEDDASEDDESEDDASEDDESEDDASEDDASEDDASEDDESEDDASEDDESEDDNDQPNMVLAAELIWTGSDITRTENVACSDVSQDSQYDSAELPVAEGEECADSARSIVLQAGTKIYDGEGNEVKSSSIVAGVVNTVDGFTDPADASGAVNAVMVIVSLEDEDEELHNQLTGVIGVLEAEGLTLITDAGDRCVSLEDDDTEIFETSQDSEGNILFTQMDATSLASGQNANAFGDESIDGCLEADTIIYENVE